MNRNLKHILNFDNIFSNMTGMNKMTAYSGIRVLGITGALLVSLLSFTGKGWASGIDLHWFWDNQCIDCHGHSSEFARKFLKISNGRLQGSHPDRDMRLFISNHHMNNSEVDAIYQMLLAQVAVEPRFDQECSGCHGNAAGFVRNSLTLQDGVLFGRASGQPIQDFLQNHRKSGPDDVDFYMILLDRIAREVYRP